MRLLIVLILTAFAAPAAQAGPTGDMDLFEDCIAQIIAQMPDHQHIDKFAPLACGREFIDQRQTCNLPEYLLYDMGDACRADDLNFWKAEVERFETEQGAPRSERLTESVAYCTNYYENLPEYVPVCLSQAYYVEAMGHLARPALANWEAQR